MRVDLARDLRDLDVAVEGQARNDRVGRIVPKVPLERGRVLGVELMGVQARQGMCGDDGAGSRAVHVGDVHFVIPAFGQQTGYERADLAGAENQDLLHFFSGAPAVAAAAGAVGNAGLDVLRGAILTKPRPGVTSVSFAMQRFPGTIGR